MKDSSAPEKNNLFATQKYNTVLEIQTPTSERMQKTKVYNRDKRAGKLTQLTLVIEVQTQESLSFRTEVLAIYHKTELFLCSYKIFSYSLRPSIYVIKLNPVIAGKQFI